MVDPGPNPLQHTHSSSKHTQRAQTKHRVQGDVQHVCDVSWRQRRGAHHIPFMCMGLSPDTRRLLIVILTSINKKHCITIDTVAVFTVF